MPYQDFAKFNVYELGDKSACDTIVNDVLGHMTTPVNTASSAAAVNVGSSLAYCFSFPDATTTIDLVMPANQTFMVTAVTTLKRGGTGNGSNHLQVTNGTGANHISDQYVINVAVNVAGGCTQIIAPHNVLTGGSTLRLVSTKGGGNAAVDVVVHGVLTA